VAAIAPQVDHTSDLELLPEPDRELAACTHASGSSPFTWKIGAWIALATSVGYGVNRSCSAAW
jgi:hypothetical protein